MTLWLSSSGAPSFRSFHPSAGAPPLPARLSLPVRYFSFSLWFPLRCTVQTHETSPSLFALKVYARQTQSMSIKRQMTALTSMTGKTAGNIANRARILEFAAKM
jgi:hypothetical protein